MKNAKKQDMITTAIAILWFIIVTTLAIKFG